MQTLASDAATRRAWARRSSIAEERVMISTLQLSRSPAGGEERRIASAVVSSSTLGSKGFVRNENTPRRVADTASGIVPWAVRITTGSEGESRWMASNSAMPSMPCMRRSVITTCGLAGLDRRHIVAGGRKPHGDQLQQVLVVVDQKDLRILAAHCLSVPLGCRNNRKILARASLRGVGQRTRRSARQRDAEMSAIPAALATAWHHCDLPTVRLDELARNGKAQARALDAATLGGLATAAEEE